MESVKSFLEKYGDEFMVLDGAVPTLTMGMVKEELILYNIPADFYSMILQEFKKIADKSISDDYSISNLSHGQKLILSSLIALYSNAQKILFRNFFTSISEQNRQPIFDLIRQKELEGKTVKILSS